MYRDRFLLFIFDVIFQKWDLYSKKKKLAHVKKILDILLFLNNLI